MDQNEEIVVDEKAVSPMEYIATNAGVNMQVMGPLAEAYAEGLDQLYAKDRTESGMALETQAMDVALAQQAVLSTIPALSEHDKDAMSILYGVQKGAVTVSNMVDVVDAVTGMTPQQCHNSAVILDAHLQNVPGQEPVIEYDVPLNPTDIALENFCASKGIPVYSSLKAFLGQLC